MSHNPRKDSVWQSKSKPWEEREILGFSSGDNDEEDFGITLARLLEDEDLGLGPVPEPAPFPPGLLDFENLGLGQGLDLQQEPEPLPAGFFDFEDLGLGLQQESAPLPPGASILKSSERNTATTNQEEDDDFWITDFFRCIEGSYTEDNINENSQIQESLQSNSPLEAASDTDFLDFLDSINLDPIVVDPMISEPEEKRAHEDWFLNYVPDSKIMDVNPMLVDPEKALNNWPLNDVPESKIMGMNPMGVEPEEKKKDLGERIVKERGMKPPSDVPKFKNMDVNTMEVESEEKNKILGERIVKERKKRPPSDAPKSKTMDVNTMEVEPEKENKVLGNRFVKERKKKPLNDVTESMNMDVNPMEVESEEEKAFEDWFEKKDKHEPLSPIPEYKENKKDKHESLSPIREYKSMEEHPKEVEHDEAKERDDCPMKEGINKSTDDEPKSNNLDSDYPMVIEPEEANALEDWLLKERINEPLSDIPEYNLLLSLAANYEKNYHILLKVLTPKSMFEDSAVEAKEPEETSLFDKPTEKPEKPEQIPKQVPTVGGLRIDNEKPSTSKEAIRALTLASASKEPMKPEPMLDQNVKKIQPVPVELPIPMVPIELPIIQLPRLVPPSPQVNLAMEVKRPMPGAPTIQNQLPRLVPLSPRVNLAMEVKKPMPGTPTIQNQLPRLVPSSPRVNLAMEVKKPMPGTPTIQNQLPRLVPSSPRVNLAMEVKKPMPGTPTIQNQLPRLVPPSPRVNLAKEVKKPMPGTPTIQNQLTRLVPPSPRVNLALEVKKPMPGTPTIKKFVENPKQTPKKVPPAGIRIDGEKPSTSKEAKKTGPVLGQNVKNIQPVPVEQPIRMVPIELPIIQLPRLVPASPRVNLAMEVKKPMPGTPTVIKFVEKPNQTPKQVPPVGMRIDDEKPSTSKEAMKALANTSKEILKPGPIVALNVKKIVPIPLDQQAKLKAVYSQLPRSVPPPLGVNLAREVKRPMPGTPIIEKLAEKPKQTSKKMPPAGIRIDGEKPSTSKEAKKTGPVLGQNVKMIQPVVDHLELPKLQVELPPLPRSVPAPPPSKDQIKAVWLQVCSSIVTKQLQYLDAKEKIEKKVKAGVPPETTGTFAIIDEGIREYTKKQIKILSLKWLEQFGPESMNNLRRSVTISTTQNELDNPLFAKIRIMRRPAKREVLPVDLKYTNIFCTVEINIQMKLRDSVNNLKRALYKDGIDVIQHSFDNIRVSWIWSNGTIMILNGSSQSCLVTTQLKLIPLVVDSIYRNDVNLNIKYLRLVSHARYPWAIDLRKFSQAETLSEPIFGERHAYFVDKGKIGVVAKLYESGEVQVFAMSTDRADELLGQLYNVAVKYRVKKD
ncbi:titin [Drosophila kikkawai]|uniref:Titin n=1 Tax=Drosophila kikkawai TaxID=30033 RepID=A0ABM4GP72_DROKI